MQATRPSTSPCAGPAAQVVKNKCAPPYRTAEFDILFGSGISTLGCVLDAAEATGVVNRKGAYYYLDGTRLAQGREKTLEHLKTNPEVRAPPPLLSRTVIGSEGSGVVEGALIAQDV